MYKVFVNAHLIKLCDWGEIIDRSNATFELYEPQGQEIKILVNWLLQEEQTQEVFLFFNSLSDSWKQFQDAFNYIEAAGGLVQNQEGKTLMIYRLKKWDLPKGKIEEGENPQEAAIREVEEECNLDQLEILDELPSSYHVYLLNDRIILKRTYWYAMKTISQKELIPQREEGIEEVKWMSPNEIIKAAEQTYPSLKGLLA